MTCSIKAISRRSPMMLGSLGGGLASSAYTTVRHDAGMRASLAQVAHDRVEERSLLLASSFEDAQQVDAEAAQPHRHYVASCPPKCC